jgi:hypothetical protein
VYKTVRARCIAASCIQSRRARVSQNRPQDFVKKRECQKAHPCGGSLVSTMADQEEINEDVEEELEDEQELPAERVRARSLFYPAQKTG